VIGTTVGIGSQGIVMDGTEEQRREWLPRLASGEVVASFALTEPNTGSDAASLRTTAIRDGDVYRLNGTKRFITNAPRAGMFTVMARSEPDKKGAAGISAFIVPANTPGLSLGNPDKKMGQRGSAICDVFHLGETNPKLWPFTIVVQRLAASEIVPCRRPSCRDPSRRACAE
jgi:acyl-CoA dehydrogenase